MTTFSVRVADDLALRFDAAAADLGGRSALLRRLIAATAVADPSGPEAARGPRRAARIMVRLAGPEAAAVDAEAAAFGLSRAGWVAALVRRRVRGAPTFARSEALLLNAVQGELRRIGINVNQIARALNTAVLEGRVLDLELASLEAFRAEIRGHLLGVREAFEGNLAYWEAGL
jgi:hypothetical protein